jgi:hypothetical protein
MPVRRVMPVQPDRLDKTVQLADRVPREHQEPLVRRVNKVSKEILAKPVQLVQSVQRAIPV